MNFDSESFEELTALAGRMLDDDLAPDELARLTELITSTDESTITSAPVMSPGVFFSTRITLVESA